MGNNCGRTEIKITPLDYCESAQDFVNLLNKDLVLLRRIEKTIIHLMKNEKEVLSREDNIILEYQVNVGLIF